MKIDGQWVPETHEELKMMKQLHGIKVEAYQSGVSPENIASIFAYAASSSLVSKPGEREKELEEAEKALEKKQNKTKKCPQCDIKIRNTKLLGLGGPISIIPCGCTFEWSERDKLGSWIQEPDNGDKNEK